MIPRHVVVPYPSSNSTVRVRALHWIDRLAERGRINRAEVFVHGPGFAGRGVPPDRPVLLLRNAHRLTRGRYESQILARASIGVYDLDDGLPWDDGKLPDLGRWWKRVVPLSRVAARSAMAADRLVVGNEVLADWGSRHCDDVRIVPTCVEPSDYRVRSTWEIGPAPIIGWIGSPATERYLRDIRDALAEVHRRTGARFRMISGDGPVPAGLAPFTDKIRWDATAAASIADWDIGIMPLRDGVYERAKCGYKLLQYAASGVPAIGSPVGANVSILDAMDGLAAITESDWVEALCEVLGESSERRRQRALKGLEVSRCHSYDEWEERWLEAVGW